MNTQTKTIINQAYFLELFMLDLWLDLTILTDKISEYGDLFSMLYFLEYLWDL